MPRTLIWMSWIAMVFACPPALAASPSPQAHATLNDGSGKIIGSAELTETSDGVAVALHASHLAPGPHGIHVHENGNCQGPDFKSAGGHFNPRKKEHGLENPKGPHAGDLPNLQVRPDGTAEATFTIHHATLNSSPDSLLKPGGTALVIHAKKDDQKSNPAGNAGDRVACGLITPAQAK